MKRIRFTEEQIIGVLREHDAGARTVIWHASTASRKPRCQLEGQVRALPNEPRRGVTVVDQCLVSCGVAPRTPAIRTRSGSDFAPNFFISL